jgi:DNA-binding transcriptional MerR regulator
VCGKAACVALLGAGIPTAQARYQHKDIDLIRQIRALLYQDGYTISGARAQIAHGDGKSDVTAVSTALPNTVSETTAPIQDLTRLRKDLEAVLGLLR